MANKKRREGVHGAAGAGWGRGGTAPRLSGLDHDGPRPVPAPRPDGPDGICAPGEARGFPPHPHRGFETVTYLLSGEMQHRDSWGNHGVLRPGDVQWMTAGSGLVHSEMPGATLVRDGGTLHGFQLWINLPRKDKMIAPRYQDTTSERIPVARDEDGAVQVKVIAGRVARHAGRDRHAHPDPVPARDARARAPSSRSRFREARMRSRS